MQTLLRFFFQSCKFRNHRSHSQKKRMLRYNETNKSKYNPNTKQKENPENDEEEYNRNKTKEKVQAVDILWVYYCVKIALIYVTGEYSLVYKTNASINEASTVLNVSRIFPIHTQDPSQFVRHAQLFRLG